MSFSWKGLWRYCWRRQWLGRVHCTDWEWDLCLECSLRFKWHFDLFSYLFYIPCYRRDYEWLPVRCGDQRHSGLCLGYGSCRVSDQGTTLRASDLHNARATILNPLNTSRRQGQALQFCTESPSSHVYCFLSYGVIEMYYWLPQWYLWYHQARRCYYFLNRDLLGTG